MKHIGNIVDSTSPPLEVELRFLVPPEALRELGRMAPLAAAVVVRRVLTSVYYDTPDRALERRGLALRVRRVGGRYIQTLKAQPAPGQLGFRRREWETPVARATPDATLPELRDALEGVDPSTLTPLFTSRIRRAARLVRPTPETLVEVAVDRGVIETPAGEVLPISEIELELKEGPVQGFFALAQALNRAAPLRLEPRSKSARGCVLVAAGAEAATAAAVQRYGRTGLAADMPVEEALAEIVRHCLGHMLANEAATLRGEPEGAHQMRVALRRLRTTLGLFRMLIPEAQRRWADDAVKSLAGTLGAARNWDVFSGVLEPIERALPEDPDLAALRAAVTTEREAAYTAMHAMLDSADHTAFALRLLEWVETRGWREQSVSETSILLLAPLGDLADQLLERRHRTMRKRAVHFERMSQAERHRVRITMKKLRYAVEAFAAIYPAKSVARYVKRLSVLQDDLGQLNDLVTAVELVGRLGAAPEATALRQGGAILRGWCARIAAERDADLAREVRRMLKAKPFWHRPEKKPEQKP